MSIPFFSIIIPLYNKAPHIGRALYSVFNQSHNNWELILVDDASQDGGDKIAQAIISTNKRCRILKRNEPGQGGYAARNMGAQQSRGEWIAFLDADDEWKESHLESLKVLSRQFPHSSFLCSSYIRVIEDGSFYTDAFLAKEQNSKPRTINLNSYCLYSSRGRNPVQTSAVTLRRNFFFKIGGFPAGQFGRGCDRDTWLRAMAKTDLAWTPEPTAFYHRDAVNMVTKIVAPEPRLCMDDTIQTLLADASLTRNQPGLKRHIKLMANYERKNAIKRRIRLGQISRKDVATLFYEVEPLYVLLIYFAASSLGKVLVKFIYRIKGKINVV